MKCHHMLPLLLLLAGCAAKPSAPETCLIEKIQEIPVGGGRGFITVPAVLNDQKATLIVATGAEFSMITPTAMFELQLHADPRQRTTLTDIGGSVTKQNALVRSLKIGTVEMLDQSLAVGQLPAVSRERRFSPIAQAPEAGLLGADWLSGFDVELDLPHQRVALYQVHGCSGDYVPWPEPKTSLRAEIYGRGLVLLNVTVDGHLFKAKVDSGTTDSFIGAAAVAQAGLGGGGSMMDSPGSAMGGDGRELHTHGHRFGVLQIGPLHYANPLLVVSDLYLRQSNLLLGLDWLRHNRVWISYADHRVTIQPESPPTL
jgi:hypothetical protein